MTKNFIIYTALWCVLVGTGCANGHDFSGVERDAQTAVDDGTVPSLALAVAKDGRVVYAAAFGHANIENSVTATIRTAYPLASATKPITATAVMLLAAGGDLKLAVPASPSLPDGVTVERLLRHTAGLGTYARISYGADIELMPSIEDTIQKYGEPVNPPGSVSEYSNLGYGILGMVIAQASGKSYADFLSDEIFDLLGMDNSFVDGERPRETETVVAAGYGKDGRRLPRLQNDTPGAGNVYASAQDLIRFGMLHAGNGALLDSATLERMRSRDEEAFHHYYGAAHYGLGWYVRGRVAWHEGGMPGASAIIKLLPADGVAVVVLSNRSEVNTTTQSLADALLQVVVPDFVPEPLDPVAGYAPYAGQDDFVGAWSGVIDVHDVSVPCTMTLKTNGTIRLTYAVPGEPVREASLGALVNGNSLISATPGRLPSPDLDADDEPLLLLKLVRNGNQMTGAIVAYSSPDRLEYLLPFPVSLERLPPQS